MKYDRITPKERIAILEGNLKNFQSEHFTHELNLRIAAEIEKLPGCEQEGRQRREVAEQAMARLAASHTIMLSELAVLEAEVAQQKKLEATQNGTATGT